MYNGNTMRNRIQSPCKVIEVTFSPVPLVESSEEGTTTSESSENKNKKRGENNRKLLKEGGMKMKHSHPRSHPEEEVEQDKVHLLANSKLERMERRRLLDEQRRRKRIVMSRIMLEELEDDEEEEDSSDDEEYWHDEEEDSEDDSSDYDDDEEDFDGLYDDYDEEGDYDEHYELLSSPPTPSPLRQSHQSSITASSNSNNSPIGIRYTLLRLVDGVILNSVPESFLQSYTPYKVNSEALCTIRMMDSKSADDESGSRYASNYGVGEERMVPCLIVEYIRPTVTTTVVPHLTTEEEQQSNHLSSMDDNINNDSEDEAEDETTTINTNTVQQQPQHEQLRIKEEEDLSKADYRVQYLNEDEGGNVETILPMGKIQHVVS